MTHHVTTCTQFGGGARVIDYRLGEEALFPEKKAVS